MAAVIVNARTLLGARQYEQMRRDLAAIADLHLS